MENHSDTDCESLDSGLETGNSNLETGDNMFDRHNEPDTDSVHDDDGEQSDDFR